MQWVFVGLRGGLITAMQALQYKAGFWLLGFGLRDLPLLQFLGRQSGVPRYQLCHVSMYHG